MVVSASKDVAQLIRNKRRYSLVGNDTIGKDERSIKVAFFPLFPAISILCTFALQLMQVIDIHHSFSTL